MYRKNMRFLLAVFLACLVSNAFAASSVRILGKNNTNSNVATASPLKNSSVISPTRKSSLTLNNRPISTTWGQDTKALGNSSASVPVSTNRLSIINKNMQNLQKQLANVTPTSGGSAGGSSGSLGAANAAISDMMNRMDMLQEQISSIQDNISDLSNYYTKQEVDALSEDYYTSEQINEKLAAIQEGINNIVINTSAETIQQHTNQIQELQNLYNDIQGSDVTIRDPDGQPMNDVSVVNDFDEDGFQWEI